MPIFTKVNVDTAKAWKVQGSYACQGLVYQQYTRRYRRSVLPGSI